MSRKHSPVALDTSNKRANLKPREEPYWHRDSPGVFLGYRRTSQSWIARRLTGKRYLKFHLGAADDAPRRANGDDILTYEQALFRLRANAHSPASRHPVKPWFKKHAGDGPTLNEVVSQFFSHRQGHPGGPRNQPMTERARKVAEGLWNLHSGKLGRQAVIATTAKDLSAWMVDISKSRPKKLGSRSFDPSDPDHRRARQSTANRALTIVKAALNWGWREGLLPDGARDWWRGVQKFKLGEGRAPRMLADDEVRDLLAACDSTSLRRLVLAALFCGARAGELRQLKVCDYSGLFGTIRIHQTKTNKTLEQPLTHEAQEFFSGLAADRQSHEHLLLDESAAPWTAHSYKRVFNDARDRARLGCDAKFKTLRATYGKQLLLATGNLEIVAKALGHSDTKTTREHYARYLPSEVADGIAKMPPLGLR